MKMEDERIRKLIDDLRKVDLIGEGNDKPMRTVTLTKESTKDILENLLKRSPSSYGKYEMAVAADPG